MACTAGIGRRNVLQALGTGVGVAGIPSVVRAQNDVITEFKESIEQANDIRQRAGQKAWRRYLEAHDVVVSSVNEKIRFGTKTNGPSTQRIENVDTDGIDGTMSIAYPTIGGQPAGYYYVELAFQRWKDTSCDGSCGGASVGESPLDTGGFTWKDVCWGLESPNDYAASCSTSSNVQYEDSAIDGNSFGFEIDDYAMTYGSAWGEYTDTEHYGVFFDTTAGDPNCNGDDDTKILGIYDHTWTGSYSSFGITAGASSSGLSIGVTYTETQTVEHESTTTEKDGSTPFKVYKGDA